MFMIRRWLTSLSVPDRTLSEMLEEPQQQRSKWVRQSQENLLDHGKEILRRLVVIGWLAANEERCTSIVSTLLRRTFVERSAVVLSLRI